ncbi:MAG: histidinol-phosphate transaminase [Cytophagaceae bacterium]|nr:histidinol-phosphate transaminase [Cytophagaceae bacterium]
MFQLQNLIRPHLLTLTPYATARDEYSGKEGIFLDANENPIGSTLDVSGATVNRYPDPYQLAIKEKLAPIKGVRPTQIFLGNGSDEVIDLLIRAFCEPGLDQILILPPTYGMYEVSATINNVEVQKVSLTADFQIDTGRVLDAVDFNTKIIWLCSPNNPSGNLLDRVAMLRIIESVDCLVVVDEAYSDFAPEASLLPELDAHPNLVVIQTFSKAWGLAGLRAGMAFAQEDLIGLLNKIKPPYNLNVLTQQHLLTALENAPEKDEMVRQILANRETLRAQLESLPIVEQVFASDSNQLLTHFTDSTAVFAYLLSHLIIVRDRSKVVRCENCLRITVGTAEENAQLIRLLNEFPVPEKSPISV